MSFDHYAANGASLWQLITRQPQSAKPEDHVAALRPDTRKMPPELVHPILELAAGKAAAGLWFADWRSHHRPPTTGISEIEKAIVSPVIDLNLLPTGSWFLEIPFTLKKPLLSKDDHLFYPTENPYRKDRALQFPVYAGSSWKGCLRSAFLKAYGSDALVDREALFGSDPPHATPVPKRDLRQGRLTFFSTCFTATHAKLDWTVINPHDRRKRIGVPVVYECVPAGAQGRFSLLYCPFDLCHSEQATSDAFRHLKLLMEPIQFVLGVGGFGAKTSSGFGVVKDDVSSAQISMRKLPKAPPTVPKPEPLPPASFHYLTEAELSRMGGKRQKEYHRARTAFEEALAKANEPPASSAPSGARVVTQRFVKMSLLHEAVSKLEAQ